MPASNNSFTLYQITCYLCLANVLFFYIIGCVPSGMPSWWTTFLVLCAEVWWRQGKSILKLNKYWDSCLYFGRALLVRTYLSWWAVSTTKDSYVPWGCSFLLDSPSSNLVTVVVSCLASTWAAISTPVLHCDHRVCNGPCSCASFQSKEICRYCGLELIES